MGTQAVETIELDAMGAEGWRVAVFPDDSPESPRTAWENAGSWTAYPNRDQYEGARTDAPEDDADDEVGRLLVQAFMRAQGDGGADEPSCRCEALDLEECYPDADHAARVRDEAHDVAGTAAAEWRAWDDLAPRETPHGFGGLARAAWVGPRRTHKTISRTATRDEAAAFAARCARVLLGAVVLVDDETGGWWHLDAETVRAEWGGTHGDTAVARAAVAGCLQAERDTYRAWCAGEVYGVVMVHEEHATDDDGTSGRVVWGVYLPEWGEERQREAIVSAVETVEELDGAARVEALEAVAAIATHLGWSTADQASTLARRVRTEHEAAALDAAREAEGSTRLALRVTLVAAAIAVDADDDGQGLDDEARGTVAAVLARMVREATILPHEDAARLSGRVWSTILDERAAREQLEAERVAEAEKVRRIASAASYAIGGDLSPTAVRAVLAAAGVDLGEVQA